MKYYMYPVVSANDLARELKFHYDIDMYGDELMEFLFGDDYYGDCRSYFFNEEVVYQGYGDEESCRIQTCINSILQDNIPGYDVAMISLD